MWVLNPSDEFRRKTERWPNKHRREMVAMLRNLETVLVALQGGARVQHLRFGFLRREPRGVKAISQGGGRGLKESRLYVFPDEKTHVLHQLTVGDKKSQKADLRYCEEYVLWLCQEKAEGDDYDHARERAREQEEG